MIVDDPCPTCHGTGHRAPAPRRSRSASPPGVTDGQRIRLKGRGGPGRNGGPTGRPLRRRATSSPHPLFGRKGRNLTLTVPVTFAEAALGADIKVPTLDGAPVTLRLPPGTRSGRTFRVKGRGVADGQGRRRPAGHRRGGRARRSCRPPSARRSRRWPQPAAESPAPPARWECERHGRPRHRHQTNRAVYVISVAAELAGVHPQTLRIYERKGLVDPARTDRRQPPLQRRTTSRCCAASRSSPTRVSTWPGVQRVLELEADNLKLRSELDEARVSAREELEEVERRHRYDLVPVNQSVVLYQGRRRRRR